MVNAFSKLVRAIKREIDGSEPKVQGSGLMVKSGLTYPRTTEYSLTTMKYILDRDENVALAAEGTADAVIGAGFEVMVQGKNDQGQPLTEQQKEIILEPIRGFFEDNDFDIFARETVKEIVALGVSFTEKLHEQNGALMPKLVKIARLPVDDNWRVEVPKYTGGKTFTNAWQGINPTPFTPDNLILWRFNRSSAGDWFGRGICYYMAQEKYYKMRINNEDKEFVVPPLYVTLWALQDDLRLAAHHLAPKTILNAPDADDNWVTNNAKTVNSMNAGESIVANAKKLEKITIESNAALRLDPILNYYDQLMMRASQTPSAALYGKTGANGLFAEQVMSQYANKITMLRKSFARTVEREILRPLQVQNGISPKNVTLRIQYLPTISPISQLQDYVALWSRPETSRLFSDEEKRKILKNLFKVPISDSLPSTAQMQSQAQPLGE